MGIVVSSLVSSVYVRLCSSVFKSNVAVQVVDVTVFSELLSQLLKIGRSAVRPHPGPRSLGMQIGSYEEGASPSSSSSSDGVIRARYTCSVVISAAQLAASSA